MDKGDSLTLIVSVTQILGFVAVVCIAGPVDNVICGMVGFAAVVHYFLPTPISREWFRKLKANAAVCGVGLMVLAIATV